MANYDIQHRLNYFESGGNMTAAEVEVEVQKIVDKLTEEITKQISEINDINISDEYLQRNNDTDRYKKNSVLII